ILSCSPDPQEPSFDPPSAAKPRAAPRADDQYAGKAVLFYLPERTRARPGPASSASRWCPPGRVPPLPSGRLLRGRRLRGRGLSLRHLPPDLLPRHCGPIVDRLLLELNPGARRLPAAGPVSPSTP